MDVSAALGHISPYSPKVLTESVYVSLRDVQEITEEMQYSLSPSEAWLRYAKARMHRVNLYWNPRSEKKRALARLIASMRITEHKEALEIEKNLQDWRFVRCFGDISKHAFTPTYIPAVYTNYIHRLMLEGRERLEAIRLCTQILVPWVARGMSYAGSIKAPLNFNKVAEWIKKDHCIKCHSLIAKEDGSILIIQNTRP